jgi:bifunctional UDP-N-acetylglucosamine pyrophosphorylase / glucosamine-1-phosphate N-acetyltransferase
VEGGIATQIVEQKDCTPQQAQVKTCNAGVYCFDAQLLAAHIGELSCENAQHEFYLTDMVGILRAHGAAMAAVDCADADELMGVNSRIQLAQATRAMQERINRAHMAAGVTMLDPTQVWIGPDVQIGRDTEILPGTMLWGKTVVGQNCVLGPQTRLTDTRVGDGCVLDETVAVEAVLESDVNCGPRAYLRPGAHLLDGAKAGTHVEIKKSTVGKGSKVPHLSYIGDCTIGEGVNIGAGTITCNYDGKNKHATTIGDGTFIGSDTMLVAPVNIGANCTVGAGSTITKDVPDGSLALERSEQKMKAGWRPKWDRG